MNQGLRTLLGRITAGAVSFTVLTYFIAIAIAIALVTSTALVAQLQSVRVYFLTGAFLVYPIFTPIPIDLLLIIVLTATLLLDQIRLPSGVPCNPLPSCIVTPKAFASLAYFPISEEIAFRITPLGLIVTLRSLSIMVNQQDRFPRRQRLRVIALSFLSPESAKSQAGLPSVERTGFRKIHWIEWIFILATSVAFGLAHVLSPGTSWDPGKAVTAGISGFALAIVFLTYGAYAAILLHWFFDFYLEIFEVGANVFGAPVATLGGLVALTIFLVGVLSILVAIAWLVKRAISQVSPTTYKPPEPD